MPEMTPLEAARLLEMDARDCMYISKIKINVAKRLAASYLREIANGEYKQVVHGRWVKQQCQGDYGLCSECNCRIPWIPKNYKHCPSCGAVMDEKEGNRETV